MASLVHVVLQRFFFSKERLSTEKKTYTSTVPCAVKYVFTETKPYALIHDRITSASLRRDMRKVSPHFQTSSLEAFHSLLIRYCPKHTHFKWLCQLARYFMNVFTILHMELKHLFVNYGRHATVQKVSELYTSELYIKQEIHKTVIKAHRLFCVSVRLAMFWHGHIRP